MEFFTEPLGKTMQQSLLKDLQKFLELNKSDKYVIYSDYCLDDKQKPNKVASFTIAPAFTVLDDFRERIKASIPKDIKKTSQLSREAIATLNSKLFFHINFLITNLSGLLPTKNKTEQQMAIESIDETISMINGWIINQPEGKQKFQEQINRFLYWKSELAKKSANIALYRKIIVISLLASYIAYMITSESKAKTIVWFPDRDAITDSYNNIAFDLFEMNHSGLCEKAGINAFSTDIGFGIKDHESELWFDDLIRIPDYLAGTLASWDLSNNLVQKSKHVQVLREVFAENDFCSIIRIDFNKNKYEFGRHTVSLL